MTATFTYIARDTAGQRVTGKLAGASEAVILAELEARQLAPVEVREVREGRDRRRASTRQLATMYRQLSDLLRAGVPLLRALRLLGRNKSNPHLARVMAKIADDVAEGARLADAMQVHGRVFPNVQVAMVRAGERGGFLEAVLQRMSTFLEHQADIRSKIVGNLIYPALLLSIGGLIIVGALIFFVPKFRDFYARIEVPTPTRLLLAASDLMVNHWLTLLIAAGGLIAGLAWLWHQPAARRTLTIWQGRVPKLGPLTQSLAVARFCRVLGTLLGNGIPMLAAMQISRDAAGHVLLSEAIDGATEAVRAGETLIKPLSDSGLFPEDILEMIHVGESANSLPQVLLTIAETLEKRIDRMLSIFIRLMEPAILLMLAGVVMFIFVALIVPMLRLSSSI